MDIDLSYLAETSKKDKIIVDNLSYIVNVTNPKTTILLYFIPPN